MRVYVDLSLPIFISNLRNFLLLISHIIIIFKFNEVCFNVKLNLLYRRWSMIHRARTPSTIFCLCYLVRSSHQCYIPSRKRYHLLLQGWQHSILSIWQSCFLMMLDAFKMKIQPGKSPSILQLEYLLSYHLSIGDWRG